MRVPVKTTKHVNQLTLFFSAQQGKRVNISPHWRQRFLQFFSKIAVSMRSILYENSEEYIKLYCNPLKNIRSNKLQIEISCNPLRPAPPFRPHASAFLETKRGTWVGYIKYKSRSFKNSRSTRLKCPSFWFLFDKFCFFEMSKTPPVQVQTCTHNQDSDPRQFSDVFWDIFESYRKDTPSTIKMMNMGGFTMVYTCVYNIYVYIRQMRGLCPEPQPGQATHHHHHHHHQTLVEDLQNKDRSLTEVR